jgi:hypothetical protein
LGWRRKGAKNAFTLSKQGIPTKSLSAPTEMMQKELFSWQKAPTGLAEIFKPAVLSTGRKLNSLKILRFDLYH